MRWHLNISVYIYAILLCYCFPTRHNPVDFGSEWGLYHRTVQFIQLHYAQTDDTVWKLKKKYYFLALAVIISKNGNRKEFNGADSAESSNKLGSLTVF